jgi:hypothetical protein
VLGRPSVPDLPGPQLDPFGVTTARTGPRAGDDDVESGHATPMHSRNESRPRRIRPPHPLVKGANLRGGLTPVEGEVQADQRIGNPDPGTISGVLGAVGIDAELMESAQLGQMGHLEADQIPVHTPALRRGVQRRIPRLLHRGQSDAASHARARGVHEPPIRGGTLRTAVGEPGGPPAADLYSGTPTHVNSRPFSDSPSRAGTSLSMNVMPQALAPSA